MLSHIANRSVRALLTAAFLCGLLLAQQSQTPQHDSAIRRATVNFREIAKLPIQSEKEQFEPNENEQTPPPPPVPFGANIKMETALAAQPSVTSAISSPSPVAGFLAAPDNHVYIPPDTSGAVGSNYLVVALNGTLQIQDRSGGVVGSTTLLNFWSPFAPFSVNPFDPRILYDPYAQRFILVSDANAKSSNTEFLIAVTQTSDPTGNWFEYAISTDTTGTLWADYPSVGFNKDWIVITGNMFALSNNIFQSSNIFVLPKATLYAGNSFTFSEFAGIGPSTLSPSATYDPTQTVSTMYLVNRLNGNSGGMGCLELSKITGPVGSETLTPGFAFPCSASPWADSISTSNILPQSGSSAGIDQGDSRMMNVVYRNGSLWCVQDIFLPANSPTRGSIQWWQLGTGGSVLQKGLIDDATGTLFRSRPSIAVNQFSDVLIGYSLFSSSIFAGSAYSFRSSTLPVNAMESETLLKSGLSSYLRLDANGRNRWGDYSFTQVDPANDSDLWTIQEFANSATNNWGTWWGKIPAPLAMHLQVSAPAASAAGSTFSVTVTALDSNNNPTADYTGTVHFTSSDGLASLPADSTLTNGTGTFNVALGTAGNQTITATDTMNGTINGSTTVSVSAGPATHLTIQTPTNAVAGAPFSVTVNALDQFNNLATGYTNTAHFTCSDGAAVLPANYTFTSGASADNGSHTFTNGVTLNTAGSQTTTVTDSSSLVVTSAPIIVKLASTTQLGSSLNPAYFRHATVTLTATVGTISGVPTGSVIFYDGNAALGAANLNSGVATLTVSTLPIGSHSITASYGGDSSFAPSNSSVLLQRRSPAPRSLR